MACKEDGWIHHSASREQSKRAREKHTASHAPGSFSCVLCRYPAPILCHAQTPTLSVPSPFLVPPTIDKYRRNVALVLAYSTASKSRCCDTICCWWMKMATEATGQGTITFVDKGEQVNNGAVVGTSQHVPAKSTYALSSKLCCVPLPHSSQTPITRHLPPLLPLSFSSTPPPIRA